FLTSFTYYIKEVKQHTVRAMGNDPLGFNERDSFKDVRMNAQATAHMTSMVGRRDYQEDTLHIQSGYMRGDQTPQEFLTGFVGNMVDRFSTGAEYGMQGSTFTGFVISEDLEMDYTHMGDSPLWVVVHDKAMGTVNITQLTEDHNLKNKNEADAITTRALQEGRTPLVMEPSEEQPSGRVLNTQGGGIAVTRAIGDNSVEDMIREPETGRVNLLDFARNEAGEVDPDIEVHVVAGCDGLLDETFMERHRQNLQIKMQNASDEDDFNLADEVAIFAYEEGSEDNISAVSVKIPHKLDRAIAGMVADGHGGSDVSRVVRAAFEMEVAAFMPEMRQGPALDTSHDAVRSHDAVVVSDTSDEEPAQDVSPEEIDDITGRESRLTQEVADGELEDVTGSIGAEQPEAPPQEEPFSDSDIAEWAAQMSSLTQGGVLEAAKNATSEPEEGGVVMGRDYIVTDDGVSGSEAFFDAHAARIKSSFAVVAPKGGSEAPAQPKAPAKEAGGPEQGKKGAGEKSVVVSRTVIVKPPEG
ncbi:MAG: hypothetical protein OXT65_13095, partial [Alphaproteobacteria bacterium]|nr:hypothetical protein [Alphaproteobacteria bacterium]